MAKLRGLVLVFCFDIASDVASLDVAGLLAHRVDCGAESIRNQCGCVRKRLWGGRYRRASRASGRSPSEGVRVEASREGVRAEASREGLRAEASREGVRAEASRPPAGEGAAGSAGASCGAEAGGGSPAACSSKAGLAAEKAAEEAEGAAEGAAARATLLGRGRRSLTRLLSAALGVGAQLLRPRRIEHARDAGSSPHRRRVCSRRRWSGRADALR